MHKLIPHTHTHIHTAVYSLCGLLCASGAGEKPSPAKRCLYSGTESCPSLVYVSTRVCIVNVVWLSYLIVEAAKNGHVHIIASEIVAVWGLVIELLCYDLKIST